MTTATLNGSRVISVRFRFPWRGVWSADVDVDPDVIQAFQTTGPASLVLGIPPAPVTTIVGTLDPLASGTFVASAHVRILGGGGGWSKTVPAQDFEQPGGVLSTDVYQSTGALVAEVVTDLVPTALGAQYERSQGRASEVLDGVDWWVDPITGTTFVGPRSPAVPDLSLELLEWDPLRKLAIVSCDALVIPGTLIVDTRIGESPVTVRDVEQTFDASGIRATCWCSVNPVSPLQAALRTMVREFSGVRQLAVRKYAVYGPGEGSNTWNLQAVDRDVTGAPLVTPDIIPATAWSGIAGGSAKLAPSQEVLVFFVDADPGQPAIVGYSLLGLPLEATLDAQASVHLAPTAPAVDVGQGAATVAIAGGAAPVALASLVSAEQTKIATSITEIAAYINGIAPGTVTPYTPSSTAAAKTTAT